MNLVERVYRIGRSKNLEMNTRIYASALSSLTATILITLIGSGLAQEPNDTKIKGWPEQVKEIKYPASADKTLQPMLLRAASGKSKRPLLVGLHSWSGNYTQAGGEVVYARWCIEKDWHFIHPNFRGPNWTADACGSDKVVKDIVDAVAYMKKNHQVDADRIYLIGVSGGGHASLLMAGRAPDIWAGVSAWVPISDLQVWWPQGVRWHIWECLWIRATCCSSARMQAGQLSVRPGARGLSPLTALTGCWNGRAPIWCRRLRKSRLWAWAACSRKSLPDPCPASKPKPRD